MYIANYSKEINGPCSYAKQCRGLTFNNGIYKCETRIKEVIQHETKPYAGREKVCGSNIIQER